MKEQNDAEFEEVIKGYLKRERERERERENREREREREICSPLLYSNSGMVV